MFDAIWFFLLNSTIKENSAGIFKQSFGSIGTEKEEVCRARPPGYTAWRNEFIGIDSWAP
jgi:hypothetical protein